MPYKQDYNRKTVKGGASRTPKTVMGGQGKPATIPTNFNKSKKTKHTKFPQ